MVNWEDGIKVSDAYVNEDGTIMPAVYSGNTPLTAHNLNKMQNDLRQEGIIVSPTEPTTSEKVWIQKGDNLFDKNSITRTAYFNSAGGIEGSSANYAISDYMSVVPGEKYTYQGLTNIGTTPYSIFYDEDKNFVSSFKQNVGLNIITIPEGVYFVRFSININADYLDEETFIFIKGIPKIYIKNDNGAYEQFINADEENVRVGWIEPASGFKYRKIEKNVEMNVSYSINNTITNGGWLTLSTLPEEYRPHTSVIPFPVLLRNSTDSTYLIGLGHILEDGTVRINQRTGSSVTVNQVSFSVIYSTVES